MGEDNVEASKSWLQNLAKTGPDASKAFDSMAIAGLQVLTAQQGRILCNFVVPKRLTDKDGNWNAGAIATLIDDVGAMAIASVTGQINVSISFDISYFSTAKILEEVEIDARALPQVGKLGAMMVEIRKKENGEMVALGKQWMTPVNVKNSKL